MSDGPNAANDADSYVGMVSADGRWRWDGTQWAANLPTAQSPAYHQPPDRMPGQSLSTPLLMTLVAVVTVVLFMLFIMIISGV